MSRLYILSALSFVAACFSNDNKILVTGSAAPPATLKIVSDIAMPEGYQRISLAKDSFGEWLRNTPVKTDNHVYLYNGALKKNQAAHFAVLDIPVGKKDLQQCADAVMRLRAEYLFTQKRFEEIEFRDNNNKSYKWAGKDNRVLFEKYLETVFRWCGSASLEKQLKPVGDLNDIQPGDVLIKGRFPGHAMIVTDVAINDKGKKLFLLAQSYMPAQDIHIVNNPLNDRLNPWYEVNETATIITPEWEFYPRQLRRW